MSDSDSDFLTNPFQRQDNTILKAAGPAVATTLRLGCNRFANSSSHKIPKSYEHQGLYSSARSLCSYKNTSSASTRSVADWPRRNFQHSIYNNSRRDFNGRCTSPESVRSIGSNVSCVTVDTITSALQTSKFNEHDRTKIITTALETSKFNEHDRKKIRNAFRKFMNEGIHKRRAKRVNVRKFLKGGRDVSGGESGDQASSSSISSDDCRSTRTGVTVLASYKRRASLFKRPKSRLSDDPSISKIDISSIRKTITDNSNYNDCTKTFYKQSALPSKYLDSINDNHVEQRNRSNNFSSSPSNNKFKKPALPPIHKPSVQNGVTKKQGNIGTKSHYLLPSQRFNKSTVSNTILEEHENKQTVSDFTPKPKVPLPEIITETYSLGSDLNTQLQTKEGTQQNSTKRKATEHEEEKRTRKKIKRQTPEKIKVHSPHRDKEKTDFEFARPAFPINKFLDVITEKVIAQSHPQVHMDDPVTSKNLTTQDPLVSLYSDKVLNSTTDVSARPSFLKRKLFTQTMDITEIRNISNDNSLESPTSNIYSDSIKDKRESRKLVSGQSCLMREVSRDNDLLDLVQKIVPIDQLQSFSQRSNVDRSKVDHTTTTVCKNDKVQSTFDVTSILTNCNEDQTSDTYTDEEIFTVNKTKIQNADKKEALVEKVDNQDSKQNHQKHKTIPKKSPAKHIQKNKKVSISSKQKTVQKHENKVTDPKPKEPIISHKMIETTGSKKVSISQKVPTNVKNDTTRRNLSSYSKSFWDSDSEWENPSNNTVRYLGSNQDVRVKLNKLEDHILKETLRRDNLMITLEDTNDSVLSSPVNERTAIEAKKCHQPEPTTLKGPELKQLCSDVSKVKNGPIPTKNNKNIKVLAESVKSNSTRKRTPNKNSTAGSSAIGLLKNGKQKKDSIVLTQEIRKQKDTNGPTPNPSKLSDKDNKLVQSKTSKSNNGNLNVRTRLVLRSSIGVSDDSLLSTSRRSERLRKLTPNERKNIIDQNTVKQKNNNKQQVNPTKSNRTPYKNKIRTTNNSSIKRVTPQRKKPISSQSSSKKQTSSSKKGKALKKKEEINTNVSSEKENTERQINTRSNTINRSASESKMDLPLKPVKNIQSSNFTMNSKSRTDNLRRALNNILNDSSPTVTREKSIKNNTIFNLTKQPEHKTVSTALDSKSKNSNLHSYNITRQQVKPNFTNGKLTGPDAGPKVRKETKKEEVKVNNKVNTLAKATIGIIPRHCGLDEVYKSGGFDDTKSMLSFRSTTTVLTRSKRLKMLHIF